jgi:hypothetical protein
VIDDSDSKAAKPADPLEVGQFGFVERRARRREKPGTVAFDDLGNAQYQWCDDRLLEDGTEGDTRRQRALSVANLVLVDDEPPPDQKSIAPNRKGLRVGYNPYDSGRLEKQQWKKPRDLRALSKWIESQRARAKDSDSEDR